MAARLALTPTRRTLIQSLPCPGFSKTGTYGCRLNPHRPLPAGLRLRHCRCPRMPRRALCATLPVPEEVVMFKLLSFVVQEHIGQENEKSILRSRNRCLISVVIHIAEIAPIGMKTLFGRLLRSHRESRAVAEVAVELHGGRVVGQPEVGAYTFLDRHRVAARQKVRPAVVIIIEKPGGESMA